MPVPLHAVRVEASNGNIYLTRAAGGSVVAGRALQQLCRLADVPWSYARRIPPTLLVSCLNHGLAQRANAFNESVQIDTMPPIPGASLQLRGYAFNRARSIQLVQERK